MPKLIFGGIQTLFLDFPQFLNFENIFIFDDQQDGSKIWFKMGQKVMARVIHAILNSVKGIF